MAHILVKLLKADKMRTNTSGNPPDPMVKLRINVGLCPRTRCPMLASNGACAVRLEIKRYACEQAEKQAGLTPVQGHLGQPLSPAGKRALRLT